MSENEDITPLNCKWCENKATRNDFREIDGCLSKIVSCDTCFNLDTKYLLNLK